MIKIPISQFLKHLAYKATAVNEKIKALPKKLQLLADFLEKEPIGNFISEPYTSLHKQKSVIIPLTLNKNAIKSFKKKTSEFPSLFKSGEVGPKGAINFINIVGQLLTDIAMLFELYHLQEDHSMKPPFKKLFKIWGSQRKMGGRLLSQEYHSKSNEEAKKSIASKLKRSADVIQNEIIPVL